MNYEDSCHYRTEEVICPHCEHEYQDSWEFPDRADIECSNCEKEFFAERNTETTYSTRKTRR